MAKRLVRKPTSVVAVISQKGGVSKSTLCIHLAGEAVSHKLRAAVLELDSQGTTSVFWSGRRAKLLRPDDMVSKVDSNPVEPQVRRVDPSVLEPTLEQMRNDGVEFIVLDLPGAHNPAVNRAIQAADYTLIPCRPSDVDLHSSLETSDAAKRLGKPFAYVLTFVPSTGPAERKFRDDLESLGFTVAPKGLGDRRKEYGDAMMSGMTVQEMKPNGASATEIRAIYKWLRQQLEVVHGRQAA